jgi:hypothetical protein
MPLDALRSPVVDAGSLTETADSREPKSGAACESCLSSGGDNGDSTALDVSAVSAAAGSLTGGVSGSSSADGAVATTGSGPAVSVPPVEGSGVVSVGNDSAATVVVLDAALSPADVAEPVWAPPELCTVPDRGSVVVDVDSAADVAGSVEERPVDVEPDAESDDTLDVELDESDDEDELESDVSATATHGVVATAVPMPSATASAPTRPMYFALPITAPPTYTNTRWGSRCVCQGN